MDRFQAIEVFVKVAERGGFAAAARDLAMSPPAVTRAIASLEQRLGTRLFVRTTRQVRLTEAGERFLDDAASILQQLSEAEESAVGAHAEPRGNLRITAPVLFGRIYVVPILLKFLKANNQVTATTFFIDRVVNLIEEGIDVAVRVGEPTEQSQMAIRVGFVRRVMVAAPSYLKQQGSPVTPDDLINHRLIQPIALEPSNEWRFHKKSKNYNVHVTPHLSMNTNDGVIAALNSGGGISRLLSYQAAPDIESGNLVPLLEEFEPDPIPVYILHQEGRMVSAKVRRVVDFMVEQLRKNPALK